MRHLSFKAFNNPFNSQHLPRRKTLIMVIDSGDRSNQVQDEEKNINGEKSPVPASLKREIRRKFLCLIRNKDLNIEWQKKKRKWVENRKISAIGEDSVFLSTCSSSQVKQKSKVKRWWHRQPTSPSSSFATYSGSVEESHNDRFKIITAYSRG